MILLLRAHTSHMMLPQGLIKDILDVPDNLERAAASVPEDAVAEGSTVDADKLRRILKGLLEGVRATEKIMLQVWNPKSSCPFLSPQVPPLP